MNDQLESIGPFRWDTDQSAAVVTAFELAVDTEPTIAVDVDSVMFPVNELVVLPSLRMQGFRVELEDIIDFDYHACLTASEARAAMRCLKSATLYDGWNLTQAEAATLKRLRHMGRVIAATSPFVQHASSKWSYCHRAGFAHSDIAMIGDKTLLKFDVLVDDRPDTLMALPSETVIVFDRPWNRDVTGRLRVEKFSEIPEAVALLLERRS